MTTTPLKDLPHTGEAAPSSKTDQPITQEKQGFRHRLPEWMKQLPQPRFPEEPNENFELLEPAELERIIAAASASPETIERLKSDLAFLDRELMRLFRQRDFEAKYHQNRYRAYQIGYMILATSATLVGSFLAVSLNSNPDLVPVLGFIETIIAVMTTFLATISSNEPALPLWLENRRKAEQMRREYFRFLMDLPPYDGLDEFDRRRRLSLNVANINRGVLETTTDPMPAFGGFIPRDASGPSAETPLNPNNPSTAGR